MRRFRFVGDKPSDYDSKEDFPELYNRDHIFSGNFLPKYWDINIEECFEKFPEDWQEVFDEPNPLHKDTDLGYFAGLAMQGILANPSDVIQALTDPQKAKYALIMAENLIKQLNNEM